LLLSSVLHSRQIPHSLSTEAAVTAAAEAVLTAAAAAVSMAAQAAVFTAAAEASMVAVDLMAAASMAARALLAEEVTTKVAGREPAAV